MHQPGVILGLLEQRQRRSARAARARRWPDRPRRTSGSRRRRRGRAPRLSRRRPPAPARRRRRRSLRPSGCPDEERLRRGRARARRPGAPAGSARAPARAARRRPARRRARARGGRRPRAARRRVRPGSGRAVRAPACSGRPARGGSRGSRPARPARLRAAPASRRSARAAPPATTSGARRRRRRGSAGGGSGSRPRRANCALSGRISSRRTSAARRGVTWVSSGPSACTAPRWKTSPSTAPRSSTRRSAASSWSRRAASSAFKRRRHLDLVSRLAGHRQHLADEQRVAAGRSGDPRAQLLRHRRPDQAGRILAARAARAAPSPARRGGCRAAPGGPCRRQQERGAAGEQRDVLDQVEERLLAPLDVVEHDDERRLLLEQLAERPGDLLRRRPRLRLPQQRADRRRGGRIGRQRVELLDAPPRPASR